MNEDYHHFKGQIPRSDYVQRLVVERIMGSNVEDGERESSKIWELKHCSSCTQIGRMLALKRGLDIELTEVICVLHDIFVIDTGKYENHAEEGAKIASEILFETKMFSEAEISIITEAIAHHSEKQIYTKNPYIELVKDADVYDCSLYAGTHPYYKKHKPQEVYEQYLQRIKRVSKELNLPVPTEYAQAQ